MNFGTFCSGIGAPEVAWHRLGWRPVFFSEIAPFPSAVLKAHWPDVPNLGDMNFAHEKDEFKAATVDVICAGTPCQSFSLAGLRAGLNSPNGNLALQFLRLLDQKRPRWMVWENVPGVFSSWTDEADGGTVDGIGRENRRTVVQTNDFDTLLAGFVEVGYGIAWRVLDAQAFGVPQRRQRVFVVGHYGGLWQRAAAVLFDPGSLSRHPTKGGKARQGITAGALCGSHGDCDDNDARTNHIVTGAMTAKWRKGTGGPSGDETQNLILAFKVRGGCEGGGKGFLGSTESSFALTTSEKSMVFDMRNGLSSKETTHTIQAGQTGHGWSPNTLPHITEGRGVRRLMPLECERLQGFPDFHTDIIYRKKPAKDAPRYEAIGNSMAVPVLFWLGKRIQYVDEICQTLK